MKSLLSTLLLSITLSIIHVYSQTTIYINLAENEAKIDTQEVSSTGSIRYQLVNTLPSELGKRNYIVSEEYVYVPVAPLDGSDLESKRQEEKLVPKESCTDETLLNGIDQLSILDDESEVPQALVILNTAIQGTTPNCREEVEFANSLIGQTQSVIYTASLKSNYYLKITVFRYGSDGVVSTWTTLIKHQKKGEWRATYGFTFAHNGLDENELFFSQKSDSAYTIEKGSSNNVLDYIPTVYFIWQPYSEKKISLGFLSGIGIEEEKPAVTLGTLLNYKENVGIALGFTAHQKQRLLGQYSEGQIINESLSEDQLHEKVWGISPSISISFRFKSSPF
ncbi:MAG: hypothetical protein BalsKO_08220 [Balneolaceae bacterium]